MSVFKDTFFDKSTIELANIVVQRDADVLPANYLGEVFQQQVHDLPLTQVVCSGPRRVLLIGGAGYVGTVVAQHLLEKGYSVRCLDALLYGNSLAISHLLNHPLFEFHFGDMGDTNILDEALAGVSDVVVLGGLVGDPITKKYPDASKCINETAIDSVFRALAGREELRRVIFISTCSNYGMVADGALATESTPLKPMSLYAKAKVEMEEAFLSYRGKTAFEATVLRFATAFGMSPRMRFDLTVSQFARDLALGKNLLVFDPDTWRPYCHVCDFAALISRVIEAPAKYVNYEVFNAGGAANNSTKRGLIDIIARHLPNIQVEYQLEGPDPRNYRVDFSKVSEQLHFYPAWTIDSGVRQVVRAVRSGLFQESEELFGNYILCEPWDGIGQ